VYPSVRTLTVTFLDQFLQKQFGHCGFGHGADTIYHRKYF